MQLAKSIAYRLTLMIFCLMLVFSSKLNSQHDLTKTIWEEAQKKSTDSLRFSFVLDQIWEHKYERKEVSYDLLDKLVEQNVLMQIPIYSDVINYYYGILYKNDRLFPKAEDHLLSYYRFQLERKDSFRINIALTSLSNLFVEQGKYGSAIDYIIKGVELADGMGNNRLKSNLTSRLGYVMLETGRLDDALDYQLEASAILKKENWNNEDSNSYANILNDIGLVYEKQELVDSMMHYYRQYYQLAVELENTHQKMYASHNLSVGFLKLENIDSSSYYNDLSIEYANRIDDKAFLTSCYSVKSDILIRTGESDKVIETLSLSDEQLISNEDLLNNYENLGLAYQRKKDFEKAMEYSLKARSLQEKLHKENLSKEVTKLELAFDRQKREDEITLLSTQNELMYLKLLDSSRWRWLLIFSLIALTAIILLMFRFIRSRKEYSEQLELKNQTIEKALNDKSVLLKEIHHRVKNNLQVISSLLSLQGRQITDPVAQLAIKEGRNRVRSMALIHQNLYQDEDLVSVETKSYIEKLAKGLFNSYQLDADQIEMIFDIESLQIDVDTVIPLGLILNELITNSLKYAFEEKEIGFIKVTLKEENSHLNMTVLDSGKGLPKDFDMKESSSLGFRLIRAFSDKLKAEVYIDDSKGGTEVKLLIPFKKAS